MREWAAALLVACWCGLGWADGRGCGTVIVPTGVGMSATPAPVSTMHPVLFTGSLYESELMDLMLRPLIWTGDGPSIDWPDSLASAVAVSGGGTVFTVTLKDIAWSDGTAVTAADVLYDWSLIEQLGRAFSQYGVGGVPNSIRSVTAPDALHVRFEMRSPVNPMQFELSGLSLFFALPRQAWARYDLGQQQTMQSQASFYSVVDGPFRLQSLALGRHAVFVPNTHYGLHRASIDRLVVEFLQGTNPLQALQAGQIDMASLPFPLWNAAGTLEGLTRIPGAPTPVTTAMTPNLRNPDDPFFQDVRVRQAIARAIDQRRMVDTLFHGQAMVQAGSVPSSWPALLPPDLRDGASPLSYDPAAARLLLDAAGWRPGADGVRVRDGRRLSFSVLTSSDSEISLMYLQLMQEDLARVGIAISIQQAEFNQVIARMLGAPTGWDATFFSYSTPSFPDQASLFQTGAFGNFEGYSNPRMDRLLAAAAADPTLDAFKAAEDFAVREQPVLFFPNGFYTVLTRPGVEGVRRALQANGRWSPEYLTLSGAMACPGAHA